MATFDLGIKADEVIEAKLMPEDWYNCEISAEPERGPNATLRDSGPDAEGAGDNLTIMVRAVDCSDEYAGRPFWLRLGFPNASDEGQFINGQPKVSWKVQRMAQIVAAFLGLSDWKKVPKKFKLEVGMKAQCYVQQGLGQDGQTPKNEINTLGSLPRPAAASTGKDSGIPF